MGLTDKHLAYGDDVPQTQTEKDYYWKIKHLEEQNNQLKEAIQKIKEEIREMSTISLNANDVYKAEVLKIIEKHLKGVSE